MAEYRRELSKDWLTASQAGELLGERAAAAAKERVTREHRDGSLLGVWIPGEQCYRYPPWQFRYDGTPVPQLRQILAILREHGGVVGHGRHTTGWHEVEWFVTPHVLLNSRAPAEVLATDPALGLVTARIEFIEEGHHAW